MNKISFGNGEGQTQKVGGGLVSSLISTGVTAGVGAVGGMATAKIGNLVPISKPSAEKIVEELHDNGDTFVKERIETINKANLANFCDKILENIDETYEIISNTTRKGLFKKANPDTEIQRYLRTILEKIGVETTEGIELTKEKVIEILKDTRKSASAEPKEKLADIVNEARKALKQKADDFLKTAKKGEEIFDNALRATKKMKNDMRVHSFAKWGAIIALGLSVLGSFIPKKQANSQEGQG